jgi:hypothetical protein
MALPRPVPHALVFGRFALGACMFDPLFPKVIDNTCQGYWLHALPEAPS